MADGQMTPPPDPENLVPDIKSTGAEKIGGFLGAISGGGVLGSISDALERHHQKRLAEAKMYHDVMVEKLSHPAYADETHPDHQRVVDAYNAAKQAYLKSAGVNKETKQQIQQRTAIAEHHVGQSAQGKGAQGQGGGGGLTPPPAPGQSGPTGGAPATQGMTPPPAPDLTDIVAGVPAERQALADARTLKMEQAEQEMLTKAKIDEERADPSKTKLTPTTETFLSLLKTINPDTGKLYTEDEALKKVTLDTTKATRPTAFQEYLSNPDAYKKFQGEIADLKAKVAKASPHSSIAAVYAIARMMEMGYKDNPAILPVVAQLAPQVFKAANMEIPPAMAEALGKIPLDQPLSPETGGAIGTSMPSAPTGATRTQAQTASRALPIVTELRGQLDDAKDLLGPLKGRTNIKFLLGKVGTTGDPDTDKKLSALRTNMELLSTLTARFHINSVRALQAIEKLADAGKDSVPAINGFIDEVEKRAKEAKEQEKGFGEKSLTPPPAPPGSTVPLADFLNER